MQHVQTIVELVTVCGLALAHAGFFNKALNCTNDSNATGNYILEQYVLNAEEIEQVIASLHIVG